MLKKMRPSELGLWAALWSIDPWGEQRADLRSAITSYVVAETRRDPKKKSSPFKPRDFMPYATQEGRAQSRDLFNRLKAALKAKPKGKR